MQTMTQLDFLDRLERRDPATVLAFPAHRMVGAIQSGADKIMAAKSWRRELDRHTDIWRFRLYVLGVSAPEIERSAARYRQELFCELLRRRHGINPRQKGGAA